MNKSSFIQEGDGVKKSSTLARRVSDMFKADGTYSGPPSLFSQKILHCCQNLNLFPYLLYSLENVKSHSVAKKVNIYFDLMVSNFIEQLLFIYTSLSHATFSCFRQKSQLSCKKENVELKTTVNKSTAIRKEFFLCTGQKQKPKRKSALLIVAVFLAPIVLAFQLIGLCSLLVFGKYTPGFIFLISSLMLLGFISMKIMFHVTTPCQRKEESRIEKRKGNSFFLLFK